MIISVIMPAYNAEKTISASVESVLKQTRTDFELIIVDDGSTDQTPALCLSYAASDARIRYFANDGNRGVGASRSRGMSEARCEWIAFLDSDDLWLPQKLEKQLAFISETGADIAYTASAFIHADGREIDYILHAERKLTYPMLLKRNLMSCSSVVVRRELIQGVGFEDGLLHEDYAAWLQIVRKTGAAFGLDEPLLVYRVSKASRSRGRVRSGAMMYRTYRAVGYNAVRSLFMTLRYAKHSLNKWTVIKKGTGIWTCLYAACAACFATKTL